MDQQNIGGVQAGDGVDAVVKRYQDWASRYEQDLADVEYRLPDLMLPIFARYVTDKNDHIFDAGAGTGLSGLALAAHGYTNITGADISANMLQLAANKAVGDKKVYRQLREEDLSSLNFVDDVFDHTIAVGTVGVAPPECLAELVRVTRPGGYVVFSNRTNAHLDPENGYLGVQQKLVDEGQWWQVEVIENVVADSKPESSPFIVYAFKVVKSG